jgi:hypothetical protein
MPSGYALAVMMNFLTTTDAIPTFTGAIERLMRRSLVHGGTILVLGGTGDKYRDIYPELDQRAQTAKLQVLPELEDPLQSGKRQEELAILCTITRSVWNKLETLAGDVTHQGTTPRPRSCRYLRCVSTIPASPLQGQGLPPR